jgi:chromosome segregation ATPase
MASELLRALSVAGITLGLVFAVLTAVGIVLVVRRNRRGDAGDGTVRRAELEADSALLRLDDAVTAGAAELDFATAQFGTDRVSGFAAALAAARSDLAEAFAVKRKLEDEEPDSDRQRREWIRRIRVLTERSLRSLEQHEQKFSGMRAAEADAPVRLRAARGRLAELRSAAAERSRAIEPLAKRYDASAVAPAELSARTASEELERAAASLAAAESRMTGPVTAVGDAISAAERSLHAAGAALDAAGRAVRSLSEADAELDRLRAATRAQLDDAMARAGDAPDADSADGITRAVAGLENVLSAQTAPGEGRDPVRAIDELQVALGRLDTALASARNQAQRLSAARQALDGALFSARSQIVAARSVIGGRPAGAGARARLSEAERELELAVHAADPVEALDAARRASTHARDADALARYSGR